MKDLDDVKMKALTKMIVELMRDPMIMFSDEIRGLEDPFEIDLMELIAYLFELVHRFYYKRPYNYMFHWANKAGSWVEEDNIDQLLQEKYIPEVLKDE